MNLSDFRKYRWLAATIVSAPLLSGCAALPSPQVGPAPQPVDSYASSTSLHGQDTTWPTDRWWNAYSDAQLDQLIEEAFVGAPDLRAAEARVLRAQALVTNSRAGLLPSLSASTGVDYKRQSYNLGLPLPRGFYDNGNAGLNLNWELDFWGKNRAALSAALSDKNATEAERAATRLALAASIAAEYGVLAGLYAERDASADAVTLRQRSLQLITARQQEGLENNGAVQRATAAHAAAEAERAALDEGITLSKHRLAELTGAGPDRGLAITRPSTEVLRPMAVPANIPAELVGRRPDITAARLRVESASRRIDVAEKRFYPNINLAGLAGLQSLTLANLVDRNSFAGSAGAAISLPIFEGGKLRAQYRGAEADYEEAVASYEASVTQALREVADAASSRKALETRFAHAVTAHDAAKAAWNVANNRYKGGLATYLDVLTAEDALVTARRTLTQLETRSLHLDIAMARALGGGFRAEKTEK